MYPHQNIEVIKYPSLVTALNIIILVQPVVIYAKNRANRELRVGKRARGRSHRKFNRRNLTSRYIPLILITNRALNLHV